MSNRIWKLYLHTSPNGKKYYGITSKNNPSERWGNNGDNYKRHPYFYNAINKYGWNNFKHEIIFDSIKDAAIKYNRNYTNLGRAIKNNKKFAGYHWEYVKEVIQLARKKKETDLSPEEERRLEITKKLNKEQKLFCYHFIIEDKSMKDAYKAAYP